jgi:hypothetical protein
MAYYTGSVSSYADIRTALIAALTANGWTWDSGNEVLYKAPMYVRIQTTATKVHFLMRTALLTDPCPYAVAIGRSGSGVTGGQTADLQNDITFPATYHCHVFAEEIYLIVNHDAIKYQFCTFGKSNVPGIPGSGLYISGTCNANEAGMFGTSYSAYNNNNISGSGMFSSSAGTVCYSPFWFQGMTPYAISPQFCNSFVDTNLDAQRWILSAGGNDNGIGISYLTNLLNCQPNAYNSESVLLPIRAYKTRPSSKLSLVLDLAYARFLRIDNYDPGQIITLGADQWKVYPTFRKDMTNRSCTVVTNHSGTFGWAIKYEP